MDLEYNDNNLSDDAKLNNYKNKLTGFNEGIDLLLEEFQKTYVLAKLYPNNDNVIEQYQSTISHINELQSNLFITSNNIQNDVNNLNNKMVIIDKQIATEKKTNRKLKAKLGHLEPTNHSSEEMINDYKTMYNQYYLRNWALTLSTLLCFVTIRNVYK